MAALFGQEIVYSTNGWPENRRVLLGDTEAEALTVPEFESSRFFSDLMNQMGTIQSEWGEVEGELNYQGVLNTAFRLRGEEIFVDMMSAPKRDH